MENNTTTRNKKSVERIIIGLGLFVLFIIGIYIGIYWNFIKEDLRTKDTPFYLVNIIIMIGAIATAVFSWWRNSISKEQVEQQIEQNKILLEQIKNAERQTENLIKQTENAQDQTQVQIDQRLDSLYAKAIEFLKQKNDLITRKGGVHILKDLAITSSKHTQKCIDMLCSLNETWMPEILSQNKNFFLKTHVSWTNGWVYDKFTEKQLRENFKIECINFEKLLSDISLSQNVITHLSDIIKFVVKNDKSNNVYSLSYKYLCSIDLSFTDLVDKFEFTNVNLIDANLSNSNLEEANFYNCNLEGVEMKSCNLKGADFSLSRLINADFTYSKLSGANLYSAEASGIILNHADLQGANMEMGNFTFGSFKSCKLDGANLFLAELKAARMEFCSMVASNLSSCILISTNLRKADLNYSIWSDATTVIGIILGDKEKFVIINNNLVFEPEDLLEEGHIISKKEMDEWIDEEREVINLGPRYNIYHRDMIKGFKLHEEKGKGHENSFEIINSPDKIFSEKLNEIASKDVHIAASIINYYVDGFSFSSDFDDVQNELQETFRVKFPDHYQVSEV